MGLLTSAIVVGSAAMGAQALNARKERKRAQREMDRNVTRQREAMQLDQTRPDTGADVQLGSEVDRDNTGSKRRRAARQNTPAEPSLIGGLGDRVGDMLFK